MDMIAYCRDLSPEDWTKQITDKWTVKDVVAHLVGWEREVALSLGGAWNEQEQPWFMNTNYYDEFNQESVEAFKDYTPEDLLVEWKKWQDELERRIQEIGKESIKEEGDLFGWVLDEGEDSHVKRHMRQIEQVTRR